MSPRKRISIFFLVLISFQVGGYYGVMEFMKDQASERTARRIATENAPIGGHLVLSVPFTSATIEPEQAASSDNHFTFGSNIYQVIERHVYDNILYIVCVRDASATDAQETIESYVRSLAGKAGENGDGIKLVENQAKYFCTEQYSTCTAATGWTLALPFSSTKDLYSFNQDKYLFHPPSVLPSII